MAGVPSNVGHIPVAGVPRNVRHIPVAGVPRNVWWVYYEEDTCTWVHILSRVRIRAAMTWLNFMSCHTSRMHYIVG